MNETTADERLTAVDLFSGAGGLSCALHLANFDVVAAVEVDPKACVTYRTSFVDACSKETTLIDKDIRHPETLPKLEEALGDRRLDLIVGGPPCQDFSPARLKSKPLEERKALVQEYLKVLRALRPRAFLFENVPGLVQADDGACWQELLDGCGALGHQVVHRVLDAQNHGVPQRRRRLFVVGLDRELAPGFRFPRRSSKRRTVGQTIGGLRALSAGEVDPNDPDHRARRHRDKTLEYLAAVPAGGSWRDAIGVRTLPCHEEHNGHYDVYGRMRADEVAPTLTGGCTNPSRGRFIHPSQDRGLTVREAALLQTFPPSWHFHGGVEAASQQVGNAVPVELGRRLAARLAKALRSPLQQVKGLSDD